MRLSTLALSLFVGAAFAACTAFQGADEDPASGGSGDEDGGNGPDSRATAREDASPGDATAAGCPSGKGAPMVRVGDFCIDARETTFADYRAFMSLGADSAMGTRPPECAFKTSFEPFSWPRPPEQDPLPANSVDWCDAWAYCAWTGKRLCGGAGGAALDFARPKASMDEWFRACTNEFTSQFSYGGSFDVSRCNVSGHLGSSVLKEGPPGSFAGCRGTAPPFDAITDMVGNIAEWQRSCDAQDPSADAGDQRCRVRGGNWYDNDEQGCDDDDTLPRRAHESKAGIRCCADPL